MRAKRNLLAIAIAGIVAGCGGGGSSMAIDAAPPAQRVAAQAALLPGTSVTPEEAARQLMDFAEGAFPGLFPGHPSTGSLGPFAFRAYPAGIFLGVVVADGTPFNYGHVYLVGLFGGTLASPFDLGPLTNFITPVDPGPGGGGGSGNGCYDLALADTQGTHIAVNYDYSGTLTGNELVDTTVGGLTTFEGHTARQTTIVTTGSHPGITVNTTGTSYAERTGEAAMTQYGFVSVASGSSSGINFTTTIRSVWSPPFLDQQYGLAVGESLSATQTGSVTTTTSFQAGFPIPDQVTGPTPVSTSFTTKYVGQEQVSVPAGTYNTCKLETTTDSVTTTSWLIVGKGIPVKIQGSGLTIQATSVTLNGGAL